MSSAPSSPTQRFSDRVEDYVRFRPGYPREVIEVLAAHYAFSERFVVADVGSGTGLLTRLFLENGNPVTGVEPNPEMRGRGGLSGGVYARPVHQSARDCRGHRPA